MITALNRENVYIGFDLQEFNRIRDTEQTRLIMPVEGEQSCRLMGFRGK